MTEQVRFEQGKGTQYAKVAIDGHGIRQLADWHSASDTWEYLAHHYLGGLADVSQFGTDLRVVFTPQNHTSFKYKNEITVRNTPLIVFGFQIKKPTDDTKWGSFLPGFTLGEGEEGSPYIFDDFLLMLAASSPQQRIIGNPQSRSCFAVEYVKSWLNTRVLISKLGEKARELICRS